MAVAKAPSSRLTSFPGLAEYEAPDKMHEGRTGVADFAGQPVRWHWHNGERWFSVADVAAILSETAGKRSSTYWRTTKVRLASEMGDELATICSQLKLPGADNKLRATDCAATRGLLRIVQSIPSPKAEPLKQWLAQLGQERLEEIAQPSKAVDRTIDTYRKMGRDDPWIDSRLQAVAARNQLTNEWKERGVQGKEMAGLTASMSKEMVGQTPAQHRELKGLKKGMEVRDQMDRLELAFVTLGEQAATTLVTERDTQGSASTRAASMDGAKIAGDARRALEEKLGRPVANGSNFLPKAETPDALPKADDPDADDLY